MTKKKTVKVKTKRPRSARPLRAKGKYSAVQNSKATLTEDVPFKVGDKVRVLIDKPDSAGLKVGDICDVIGICNASNGAVLEVVDAESNYWLIGKEKVEKISTAPQTPAADTGGVLAAEGSTHGAYAKPVEEVTPQVERRIGRAPELDMPYKGQHIHGGENVEFSDEELDIYRSVAKLIKPSEQSIPKGYVSIFDAALKYHRGLAEGRLRGRQDYLDDEPSLGIRALVLAVGLIIIYCLGVYHGVHL